MLTGRTNKIYLKQLNGNDLLSGHQVVLPNLATLRIVVCEENGRLLGQRVLPVEGLRPGKEQLLMCLFLHRYHFFV